MKAAALLTALLLTACASTHHSPAQSFRAKGADKAMALQGRIELASIFSDHLLSVTLDGRPALAGNLGRGTADITGTLDGKPTLAMCQRSDRYDGSYLLNCRIILDGEFAGTLSFAPSLSF